MLAASRKPIYRMNLKYKQFPTATPIQSFHPLRRHHQQQVQRQQQLIISIPDQRHPFMDMDGVLVCGMYPRGIHHGKVLRERKACCSNQPNGHLTTGAKMFWYKSLMEDCIIGIHRLDFPAMRRQQPMYRQDQQNHGSCWSRAMTDM